MDKIYTELSEGVSWRKQDNRWQDKIILIVYILINYNYGR